MLTLTRDDQKKDAHPGWGYVSPTMILDSDAALPLQITSLGSMDGAAVGMRVGSILTGASVVEVRRLWIWVICWIARRNSKWTLQINEDE